MMSEQVASNKYYSSYANLAQAAKLECTSGLASSAKIFESKLYDIILCKAIL